jgi:hypothetical protein
VPIARALLRRKLSGQRETLRRHPELPDAKGMERARDALDMAWAGLTPAGTHPPQVAPAGLAARRASDALADPRGYGPAAPAVSCPAAPVADAVWPVTVVTAHDLADPVSRVAGHGRGGAGGQASCQKPQDVPAAALDWFVGVAISLVQLVVGQVGFEVDASWHALVLQRCCATPYETPLTHHVSRGKAYILRPMTWRGGRG